MDIINISDNEYRIIAELIYDRSGINLGEKKKELVKARLEKRIRSLNLISYAQYYDYILADKSGQELIEAINAISTNYTMFFRENSHFEFLSKKAMPELVSKKLSRKDNKIRIWCCASATGEEPYSIAITLLEYLKPITDWDVKILATDISTKALATAQEGAYKDEQLKSTSPVLKARYFVSEPRQDKGYFNIREEVKNLVVFRSFNLMSDIFPSNTRFDIVFCRNVMIYFDKATQEALIKKLCNCLEGGGYLFIGHSENIMRINAGLKNISPAVFKKE